jgi:hypothetical protein
MHWSRYFIYYYLDPLPVACICYKPIYASARSQELQHYLAMQQRDESQYKASIYLFGVCIFGALHARARRVFVCMYLNAIQRALSFKAANIISAAIHSLSHSADLSTYTIYKANKKRVAGLAFFSLKLHPISIKSD